jgi:putative flippase GtrA
VRYLLVGATNTAIDVGTFALLEPSLGIWWANFFATSLAMTAGFLMHGKFTFSRERLDLRHAVLFYGVSATTAWVAVPFVIWCAVWAGMPAVVGKVLSAGVGLTLNFLGYRYVVFR